MRTVPLSEAKDRLSALVEEADSTHEVIRITRHGKNAAVLMSADELESLHETLRLLSTPGAAAELQEAKEAYASKETTGGADARRRYGL
ncbi:hypothetical protein GCM10023169_13730 [Georgenia halophila]|uniref:Antitoxin n=1 Tax=Georgenia halophila TaxID=620889 RepID=A0ABP8L2Z7_9MICO